MSDREIVDAWVPVSPQIPEHWSYVEFEEAFNAISTSNIKTPEAQYLTSGAFPIVDQGKSFVGGFTNSKDRVINEKGSVIVFGDHTRCFKLINFPFAPGADGTKVLEPCPYVLPRFAYYALLSLRLPDRGYSRHYSFLRKSRFPVAPLAEQRRIVAKIEELFSKLDKGGETLTAAREQLKAYRQSVLKHAFEGKLTEDWRAKNADKLEAPETLLARIKQEREARYKQAHEDWQSALATWRANGEKGKKPGNPKRPRDITAKAKEVGVFGWASMQLGLLIDEPSYGTSKKCDYEGGDIGVLRIPNIAKGTVDADDLKFANFDAAEIAQYRLETGDVLTIRSNGSLSLVGKPALVRSTDTRFVYAGYLIRLRPIPNSLVSKYLVYLMMEPNVRDQIERKAKSTSGVNNINAKELQDLQLPICSLAEQAEIVRLLEEKLEAADVMEAEIEAALARADSLRQSILKRAFSGKLVSQDPKDEPAAALLARIKAERVAEPIKTSRRNREGAE